MRIKYLCDECSELFWEKEIAHKYIINVGGKIPVTKYICKNCDDGEEEEGKL